MKMRTLLVVSGLLALLASGAPAAEHAALPVARVSALGPLRLAVEEARAHAPAPFAAVARVAAEVPALDAHKRGPLAVLAPRLAAIPEANMALVAAILEPPASLTGSAARAFRVSAIEALGSLRDPRARGLFATLLDDAEPLAIRAAAEALGKLGDDESVALLLPRLRVGARELDAVLGGVSACRRRAVVSAVAAVVAARPSFATTRAAVRALGEAGSSWAFRTKNVPAPAEEHEVRALAAAALIDAYVADPALRVDASNAIMVVDDPSTPSRIAEARRSASLEVRAALDRLAERFAKNPAR